MAKTNKSEVRATYPPSTMTAIPNGWRQVLPADAAGIQRSAEAFARYLTTTSNVARMRTLINGKINQKDIEFIRPMSEFWLYHEIARPETIAVAFHRSLDRPGNHKPTTGSPNPRKRNDWFITVGVHGDAGNPTAAGVNAAYLAVKRLVAYQLQLAEAHHPNPLITRRQLFIAWNEDVTALKPTQWPDCLFDKMKSDPDVRLNVRPELATPDPPHGTYVHTKSVQIYSITL